jgi:threonine aldolase
LPQSAGNPTGKQDSKAAHVYPRHVIDLFSDTATKPSAAMRRFMCDAEVGDEQRFEDPTVNRLQEMVADLLGKEAALYLPSGTMCNQISLAIACRPGDEILLDRTAHPLNAEAGGAAALTGAVFTVLNGTRGIYSVEQVAEAIRPAWRYAPRTRVVSIEQTTNIGGGACWPLDTILAVTSLAKEHGLWTHCDGARLLNAVVAKGVPAREYAAPFDSVWIDFSKGLGAPVGAVVAGSRDFIEEAWRYKQRLGGAMRQAGIIAAACIYALEHNVERLAEDHRNARRLADRLAALPGVGIVPDEVETNILMIDVRDTGRSAPDLAGALDLRHGVRVSVFGQRKIRAVTHLDVSSDEIERAAAAFEEVVANP